LVRLVACFCCQEIEDGKPDSDPTKVEVKAAKFIPQFAASNGALQVPRKVEKYRLYTKLLRHIPWLYKYGARKIVLPFIYFQFPLGL